MGDVTRWSFGLLVGLWLGLIPAALDADDGGKARLPAGGSPSVSHAVVPGFERFFEGPGSDPVEGGRLLVGELGCASCHKPGEGLDRWLDRKQAPILDAVGSRVRPEYLRAFLMDPQATKPGTTMPDILSGLDAEDRTQTVEAIVHFLGSTGGIAEALPSPRAIVRGEALFQKVGCLACHGPVAGKAELGRASVPLGDLARKYTPASLSAFLKDPLKVRPSGRMPGLGLEGEEALDLASYLLRDLNADLPPILRYRYYEGNWTSLPDLDALTPKAEGTTGSLGVLEARRANDFALRFEGFLRIDRAGDYTFHVTSDDGSRLRIDGREVVDNDGIHPPQEKSGQATLAKGMHRLDLAVFNGGGGAELDVEYQGPGLARQPVTAAIYLNEEIPASSTGKPTRRFRVDSELADRGRELFATIGCASCHQLRREGGPIGSRFSAPALGTLQPDRGCLDASNPRVGRIYRLDDRQRTALGSAVLRASKAQATPPSPRQVVTRTLTALNCYACHARAGVGGVEPSRDAVFETTQKEMGDEGRLPPHLDGVGGKLTRASLTQILDAGAKDRPYMLTRMPRFGEGNVGKLVESLETLDVVPPVAVTEFSEPIRRVKSAGRFLAGGQALGCIKCHTFNGIKAEGVQGIDMTIMTRRLRRDWFHRYLLDPQRDRPGTRMPSAWPSGTSLLPKVLGGDTPRQIESIWLFLSDGSRAAEPYGLGRDPIPLVAESEPILYRNFIRGAGPRAIGVGYPEKANLAFDANEMRIALIWQGAFIDASRHWSGRGEGFQPPLGDNVLSLPPGAPLARLATLSQVWPKAPPRELGYAFRGYRLDARGRPTFSYDYGSVRIDDTPEPIARGDVPSLRRTLTLDAETPPNDLWLRAAEGNRITHAADGWFTIDDEWRLRLRTAEPPIVRPSSGKSELVVPIRFSGKRATVVEEYAW